MSPVRGNQGRDEARSSSSRPGTGRIVSVRKAVTSPWIDIFLLREVRPRNPRQKRCCSIGSGGEGPFRFLRSRPGHFGRLGPGDPCPLRVPPPPGPRGTGLSVSRVRDSASSIGFSGRGMAAASPRPNRPKWRRPTAPVRSRGLHPLRPETCHGRVGGNGGP